MNWKGKGRLVARRLMRIFAIRTILRSISFAGLLPSWIWKRLPVEGIFSVILPDGRSILYSATPNDVIARALFWRDLSNGESETIPIFYSLAKSAKSYPGYWGKHWLLYFACMRCQSNRSTNFYRGSSQSM